MRDLVREYLDLSGPDTEPDRPGVQVAVRPPLTADEDHTDYRSDVWEPAIDTDLADRLAAEADERRRRQVWEDRAETWGALWEANRQLLAAVAGLGVFVGLGVLIWAVWFRTEPVEMTVQRMTWERSVGVEVFGPVHHEEWYSIPWADKDDAYNIDEDYRYHYTRHWQEACGVETYSSGGQTRTRTKYCDRSEAVYDWHYSYDVDRWHATTPARAAGDTDQAGYQAPFWPQPDLGPTTDLYGNQRLLATPGGCEVGDRDCKARYRVWVEGHGEADDVEIDGALYEQIAKGGTVTAAVNSRGHVRGITPRGDR